MWFKNIFFYVLPLPKLNYSNQFDSIKSKNRIWIEQFAKFLGAKGITLHKIEFTTSIYLFICFPQSLRAATTIRLCLCTYFKAINWNELWPFCRDGTWRDFLVIWTERQWCSVTDRLITPYSYIASSSSIVCSKCEMFKQHASGWTNLFLGLFVSFFFLGHNLLMDMVCFGLPNEWKCLSACVDCFRSSYHCEKNPWRH
jgi:hypothetical protein